MATFTEVAALIPTLRGHLAADACAERVGVAMSMMTDAEIVAILEESTAVAHQVEQIRLLATGVVASRSTREAGHSGLAQSRGHRSVGAFVQVVTGSSKAEALRNVRIGEALLDSAPHEFPADAPPIAPWHEPLTRALKEGRLSSAQFDAIHRGLGEPPIKDGATDADDDTIAAWRQAAEELAAEAAERTVEELGTAARTIRDLLDAEGAAARFVARFENRSFRVFRGADGQKRANWTFDDEGEAFIETLIAAALRPRRGGPRFVDAEEKARAAELADDQRTNDQLTYDLMMDVLRAGVLADAESVFGTRQVGVRFVQVVDGSGRRAPIAHTEDGLIAFPAAAVDQRICESGYVEVTVDSCGNPLDVGRESRLFTPKQRIALAVRDGGCRWQGCDRPASYCEAHHIDEWHADAGRSDIDRGILLCRFHHMSLHHVGCSITREGKGDFVLHRPGDAPIVLKPRAALTFAWGGIDPPPKRFRPAA